MDSDFFDSVIKVDDGFSESDDEIKDKENSKPLIVKPFKAKKEQFKKIEEFMNQFEEEAIGKEEFSQLWKVLIGEVNSLGPPIYTEVEWKTKWSQHKYNLKRKWLAKPLVQSAKGSLMGDTMDDIFDEEAQFSIQDQPQFVHEIDDVFDGRSTIQGAQSLNQDQPQLVTNSDVLDRLDQIIEKQDAVLVKMDKTNSLLEIIARRAN